MILFIDKGKLPNFFVAETKYKRLSLQNIMKKKKNRYSIVKTLL